MKVVYLGIILTFLLVTMAYVKYVHAESSDLVQILNVRVQPDIIKINDTFLLDMTILNNSTFPIYLTSGSCAPAFSVVFDAHAKQVYPNIACTAEAILQKVDPQSQVTISNANKPGVIYQAVKPGTANVNITLPYFAKNQTSTDYSNIYYNTSKSFLFTINGNNSGVKAVNEAVLSPLKQFKSGIKAQDVKCDQDLQLVIKSEDGSPACVKIETGKILVKRGWATTFGPAIPANEYHTSCNTPYGLKDGFISVLYMPANSLGKVCVNYSNPNNARNANLLIFNASSYQPEKSITTWAEPSVIPIGNSTVTYFVKTSNQTGFYGLVVFCVGMPLAVGYDNQSNIIADSFPWMKPLSVSNCPALDYQFKVVGVDGIGIKYIPYP